MKKILTFLALCLVCLGVSAQGTPITITWPCVSDGNASKSGNASVADVVTVNDLEADETIMKWAGTTKAGSYTDDTNKYANVSMASDATGNNENINENAWVKVSFTVKEGFDFTPTGYSFYAGRDGTDNGCVQGKLGDYASGIISPSRTGKGNAASQVTKVISDATPISDGVIITLWIYYGGKGSGKKYLLRDIQITGTYKAVTNELAIKTQPVDINAAVGESPVFTVEAKGGTQPYAFQWYSNTEKSNVDGTIISGETNGTYSPSTANTGTFYYYCVVTDNAAASVKSDAVQLTVTAAKLPEFTTQPKDTIIPKGKTAKDLEVAAEGNPTPTFQWYKNTIKSTEGAQTIADATGEKYKPETSVIGTTYYYCVATNLAGSVTSNIATVDVRDNKQLLSSTFSNGFEGFIDENLYVDTAYYMEGAPEPTVTKATHDGASYEVDGNKITVIANDGTTQDYTIKLISVTPCTTYDTKIVFDGSEKYVASAYGFDGSKKWKFSKNVNEESNMRVTKGFSRLYFFIGKAKHVEFTTSVSSDRDVTYTVNGGEKSASTKVAKNSGTLQIDLDPSSENNIIGIYSNQTSGDGGFKDMTITSVGSFDLTVPSGQWASVCMPFKAAIPDGYKAYYAKSLNETTVSLTQVDGAIPANAGVVVTGAAGTATFTETSTDAADLSANKFIGTTAAATVDANSTYVLNGTASAAEAPKFSLFTGTEIPANKAYLAKPSSGKLDVLFGEATGIATLSTVNSQQSTAIYNLQGVRVNDSYKGIVISNGKKILVK